MSVFEVLDPLSDLCGPWPKSKGSTRSVVLVLAFIHMFHGAKRPGRAALWVFPPFPSIAAVINELLLEQVNAVLILLRFMLFWYAMLQRLSVHVAASLKFITVQTVHHWV